MYNFPNLFTILKASRLLKTNWTLDLLSSEEHLSNDLMTPVNTNVFMVVLGNIDQGFILMVKETVTYLMLTLTVLKRS